MAIPAITEYSNGKEVPKMMNGMHGIGVAMMIFGAAAALAVITLAVLAAGWLARDLGSGERSGGRQP